MLVFALLSVLFVSTLSTQTNTNYEPWGLECKTSEFSVTETINRLERILKAKKFKIIARVNHTANAGSVGKELRPTELLIFGNPAIGTQLMQDRQSVGIDLPMKALAFQEEDGQVYLGYNSPSYLTHRHSILSKGPLVSKMTAALKKLTDKAVTP